ncbi:MAG: hypothetical protein HYR94_15675 [Chloroflexi bacterium]|nr:hypothetical protein [Chloroflexota bacterium]
MTPDESVGVTIGNVEGGIHGAKIAGRDIVEVVIQIVQQTGRPMPPARSLPAQLTALQHALPHVDAATRAPTQTAIERLTQTIAGLPRYEQTYLDRLKRKYVEEAAYYIPLAGETSEATLLPTESSPHLSHSARRRSHRAEAEYREWITTEREIKRVKLNTLREGVDKYPCIILLGDPGCGKTTALENLAYQFAVETTPSPALPS